MVAVAESSLAASTEAPPVPTAPEPHAVSDARLRANRANALKSTGPKTPQGKRRSSQNALVHGLRAASILAPGEDPRELIAYRLSMIRSTNPRNPIEMEYVEQVIRAGWKLRRYQAAEVEAIEYQTKLLHHKKRVEADRPGFVLAYTLWGEKEFRALPRYEQQYTRMMNRALDELRKLKKDPIYGCLGDFAGEMIEAEEEHLRELDAPECPQAEAEPENAPNEAIAQELKLSDDLTDYYDPVMEQISALTGTDEVEAMLKARLANEPEPVPTS